MSMAQAVAASHIEWAQPQKLAEANNALQHHDHALIDQKSTRDCLDIVLRSSATGIYSPPHLNCLALILLSPILRSGPC